MVSRRTWSQLVVQQARVWLARYRNYQRWSWKGTQWADESLNQWILAAILQVCCGHWDSPLTLDLYLGQLLRLHCYIIVQRSRGTVTRMDFRPLVESTCLHFMRQGRWSCPLSRHTTISMHATKTVVFLTITSNGTGSLRALWSSRVPISKHSNRHEKLS